MRANGAALLAMACLVSWLSSECIAQCPADQSTFHVNVRYTLSDGITEEEQGIPLNLFPLGDDWGEAKSYSPMGGCTTGKKNCNGTPYTYTTASINAQWSDIITGSDDGVYTVNEANILRFYKFYYAAYDQEGNVDYTKNCHGYAFDVGNWPADGGPGVGVIINESAFNPCYVPAYPQNAKIACTGAHSVKVKPGIVLNFNSSYSTSIWTIVETKEKLRESPIFKQSNSSGVVVINAKLWPSTSHSFYKPAGGSQ